MATAIKKLVPRNTALAKKSIADLLKGDIINTNAIIKGLESALADYTPAEGDGTTAFTAEQLGQPQLLAYVAKLKEAVNILAPGTY